VWAVFLFLTVYTLPGPLSSLEVFTVNASAGRNYANLELLQALCESGQAREIRMAGGVTLRGAARTTGIPISTLCKWELGQRRPSGRGRALDYAQLLAELCLP
jgi:DNA-binding transcriptional regulator YiaG